MQIIDQSVQISREKNPYKKIETAARTCYQSKESKTEEEAKAFVKRLINHGHYSVLEHLNFVFYFNNRSLFHYVKDFLKQSENCPQVYATENEDKNRYILSINYRHLLETYLTKEALLIHEQLLLFIIYKNYPELIPENFKDKLSCIKLMKDCNDCQFVTMYTGDEFFEESKYMDLTEEEKDNHLYYSFILDTDRGIMSELTRHRLIAFSVSSTRYINFEKKMGGCIFVKQENFDINKIEQELKMIEDTYKKLVIIEGVQPQFARAILTNCLWTQIFATTNRNNWNYVIKLRTSKAAHPQIRKLIGMVKDEID